MFGALGLGALLILVGILLFVVPGIGIFGIVLVIAGVVVMIGGFASSRRRGASPPP
jgi:hypothetical protein